MKFKHIPILIIFLISTILISCNGGKMPENNSSYSSLKDVPAAAWEKLSKKKIYFGHQSVGFNIIDGIKDLMKEHPEIKLNIVEVLNESDSKTGVFAHSAVGQNREPKSKNAAFKDLLMKNEIGQSANIAFFKYCYVDITAKTDIDAVFNGYTNLMTLLKKKYPEKKFIHTTVPLMSASPPNMKAWIKVLIKRVLGRSTERPSDNIKRNEFNSMLRENYGSTGYIFDLAEAESTFPDKTRCTFVNNGQTYYALVPEYTHDGGHLNQTGRKVVAEQLLLLLANIESD